MSLAAAVAVVAGAGVFTALPAAAATECTVAYVVTGEWPGGFGANVTITNLGDPISAWSLDWSYSGGQTVTQRWNAEVTQSGQQVTARNVGWNGSLATGATVSFSFSGARTSTNPVPTVFTLNGTACGGGVSPAAGPSSSPAPPTPDANQALISGAPSDGAWVASGQWDNWVNNGYTLHNDVWGAGAGSQTISARSGSTFNVMANHPRTSGVKSYPNTSKTLNRKLSSMRSITSSFDTSVPADGDFEATYDLWADNYAYEVMVWTNQHGAVAPIADAYDGNGAIPKVRDLNVGGYTWNVYRGSNGANAVFSFVMTNTNSGTIDLLAIMNWLRTNDWCGDVTLGKFQYGFEITGTAGLSEFALNNYSLEYD